MSAVPPQPESNEAEDPRHYRAMARRLADMAMQMAEDAFQDAQTPAQPGTPKPDHIDRFERASHTVRRAILLARKLAEPLPPPRPAMLSLPLDRTAARRRILRKVEDAIARQSCYDDVDVASLEAELLDRLDRPDLEDDLALRPIDEIIADIARDLGVGFRTTDDIPNGKRRTPEDIEQLEAHAAAPLPLEPHPPRTLVRAPPPTRFTLPDDPAEAIAKVLRMGRIRDG